MGVEPNHMTARKAFMLPLYSYFMSHIEISSYEHRCSPVVKFYTEATILLTSAQKHAVFETK
jgi:hypothetical protein